MSVQLTSPFHLYLSDGLTAADDSGFSRGACSRVDGVGPTADGRRGQNPPGIPQWPEP